MARAKSRKKANVYKRKVTAWHKRLGKALEICAAKGKRNKARWACAYKIAGYGPKKK